MGCTVNVSANYFRYVAKKEEQEQKLKNRLEEMKKKKDRDETKENETIFTTDPHGAQDYNLEKYL